MIQSLMDTQVWNEEFRLIRDQEHFEKVWSIMQKVLMKYVKQYIDNIALSGPFTAMSNYSLFLQKLINNNGKLNEKYHIIFDLDMMDEYGEAVEDFKNHILKKETDVIKNGLLSKSEALNEWKSKFYSVKAQKSMILFIILWILPTIMMKNLMKMLCQQLIRLMKTNLLKWKMEPAT